MLLVKEMESLFFLNPKKKELKEKINLIENEISELRRQKDNL